LDEDPELEAVLVTEEEAADRFAAYVFDRRGAWNLVGSFFCRRLRCDGNTLIRVQKLTEDSPSLLFCFRDLGGSDGTILTTEAFQLRGGQLWPTFEVTNYEVVFLFTPPRAKKQRVLASPNRLVIHTIREEPPGQVVENKCEVWRWNPLKYTFVLVVDEQATYCDPKTGIPIEGKSHLSRLSANP
jgi:hypothetical protein